MNVLGGTVVSLDNETCVLIMFLVQKRCLGSLDKRPFYIFTFSNGKVFKE